MKQILQNLGNGETQLVDIPCPQPKSGHLLVATTRTLVSIGTERMLIDFGKSNLIDKARSQPDKVKMVLEKVRTDGLLATMDAVKSKLDQPLPLGYCNVGVVMDAADTHFEKGCRVVSNGNHAEIVRVPKNLCAVVPDNVDDESAVFTVLASIALQGIRIANPQIGENVVVVGLGLIGLITVQILRANGCRVLGIDFNSGKCILAQEFGAEIVDLSQGHDPVAKAHAFSRGRGVDAVIICASTKSSEPVSQSAKMCRKRGRVILVGVAGLELSRADFYEKEISFQVSCSYGPGRYDPDYEERGNDYPVGYVRWTEQRNFEAVLDLMASGVINMKPLISSRFTIDNALDAYKSLDDPASLGIILSYNANSSDLRAHTRVSLPNESKHASSGAVVLGVVGAGNYASRILIPAFKQGGASLKSLVTSGGISAFHHGKKNGFDIASTDFNSVLEDKSINSVVIATQHNLHAGQVVASLLAGKHVFVEKPLAIDIQELSEIESTYRLKAETCSLMVGFNRRFAPHIVKMKSLLANVSEPKSFIMTMNAGAIPADHWTQSVGVGGGRIIGEACHYIDLMRFLAGSEIVSVAAVCMGRAPGMDVVEDKASITLTFKDGSFGTIHYLANGGKSFSKERIEVFCAGRTLQLDNFRKLAAFNWPGFSKMNLWRQDKGQLQCAAAFINAIQQGGPSPIPVQEIFEVSRVSIEAAQQLRTR